MQTIQHTLTTPLSRGAEVSGYLLTNSPEIDPYRIRPAIVLCPGGGYEMTSDREAEPVAMQLLARGWHVFILRYSVGADHPFPTALVELAATVAWVRAHAAKWRIDPTKIVAAGFSAGGHLAATLGTFWAQPRWQEYGLTADQIRPNALLLGYPVISSGQFAHAGSFATLLGPHPTEALKTLVSAEQQVTQNTPPTFIWGTFADPTVPVENSLMFANALHEHGVECELHLFARGGHGLSLGTNETSTPDGWGVVPPIQPWIDLFATWMHTVIV
ncbi:alpha/beta hydrolase [Lacticaseibacillus baoqingensis]|uniref:Alpha/beta hydrolase n=1 Tax=Lacticaseibacillus baoqingensis TaxID=2486013 RepID=A0ABW4E7F1_9LACO|nr:alpha/beta hydrolase [Lacticaseibacillus baoqingensis]